MKVILTALGIVSLAIGLFCAVGRVTNPSFFAKLDAVQATFGETGANALFIIAFVILPGMIGMALLVGGLM